MMLNNNINIRNRVLLALVFFVALSIIFLGEQTKSKTNLPAMKEESGSSMATGGRCNYYIWKKNGTDSSVRQLVFKNGKNVNTQQSTYTASVEGSGNAVSLPTSVNNSKGGYTIPNNYTSAGTKTTSYTYYDIIITTATALIPAGYKYGSVTKVSKSEALGIYPSNTWNTGNEINYNAPAIINMHNINTGIAITGGKRYKWGGYGITLNTISYTCTLTGAAGGNKTTTRTVESAGSALSAGSKTGYTPSPATWTPPAGAGAITQAVTWTANKYAVTLNQNNSDSGSGAGTTSVTATYDSNMPNITVPTRPGYTFQGYFDTSAAAGGTKYYNANGTSAKTWNKTAATTLYARWTANTKTYVFNKNATDATGSNSQSFTSGVSGNKFANTGITRPGYTLVGWSTTSGANNDVDYQINNSVSNAMIGGGGTTTLYAVWEPDEGFIEFSPNGGDGYMDDQDYTYDNTLNLDELAFDNEGYRFTSWNTQRDGSGDSFSNMAGIKRAFPNIKTQGKVKLYAQWEPLDYKIHFDGNNETSGKMKDQKAFMDEETTLNESDFYKKGFVQKEWNTKPDGTGIGYEDEESIRINSNLLNGTDNPELNNTGQWKNGHFYYATVNTDTARRVVEVNDSPIEGINKAFEIDGGGNYDIAQARVPIITGKTYTVSVYAKGSGTLNLQFGNGTYQNKTNVINHDDWKRYTFTFTAGTGGSSTDNYTNIYVGNRSSNSSDTIQVIGFKLEEGDTATQYLPKNNPNFTLYSIWVKGNFTLSGDTSVEGYQFEKIQTENGELKVDTRLSHNKFFSIFDLDRGAEYQISEDKDKLYAPSYEAEEGREYVDKKTDKAERNNDLSTPEETLEGNMGYHFNNERDDKAEGKNITVKKRVSGDGVTNEDKNRLFEFDYHITGLDPEYKYRLITDTGEISLTPDSNGIISGMVSIKHNESFTIAGLPEGAKYSIMERATNNWEYKSSYEVTEGTELVNSVSSVGITSLPNGLNSVYGLSINQSGELNSLGLGVETIPEEEGDIEYLFRNSKAENHNLTVKKQVDIDGETDVDSNDEFTVNMSFANLMPFTAYTVSNPNYNFTSDANGKAEVTLTIKGKEEITFFNIPGDVEYTAEEEDSEYTANVKVYSDPTKSTEAYAVFDSEDNSMTFFRDDIGKYINGQTEDTKTYYAGIETLAANSRETIPWYNVRQSVRKIVFADVIVPNNMMFWFSHFENLISIENIENLDTSNVTSMDNTFERCLSLETLDVSHFDTSKVTDMCGMFSQCTRLKELNLSNFDTHNVNYMHYMFNTCSALKHLDLSSFETSSVTNMSYMFYTCANLETICVSNTFTTGNVTDSRYMFTDSPKIKGYLGTMQNASYIDKARAKIDGGTSSPGYFSPTNTIRFNANGGDGIMNDQNLPENASEKLDVNRFSKEGYKFVGWNTKADGTGKSYSNEQLVKNIVGEILTDKEQVGNGWKCGYSIQGSDYNAMANSVYPASGVTSTPPEGYPTYAHFTNRDSIIPYDLDMTSGKKYKISGYGTADSRATSPSSLGFMTKVGTTGAFPSSTTSLPATTRSWTYNECVYETTANTTELKPWIYIQGWPTTHESYNGNAGVDGWYWTGLSVRDMSVRDLTLYAQWEEGEETKPVPPNETTEKSAGKIIYETSGMYGTGVSVNNQDNRISSDRIIGLNDDDTILFTNSKKLHNDLKISKITDGRGVKPNDEFDYTINFTGLEVKEYEIEKLTEDAVSETLSFTPNQPNCSYDFTLKDNQTLWFKGISNTATYKITEHESDGYAPSYNLIEGVAETESGYAQEGESLSSGTETLPTDAEYSFVNVKDTPPPKKFVSDNDNKTWEGTGEEKDVTENTVPDQKSEWEYKITQKVYPGYESFTFSDKIAPNLYITSADDINVKWTKEDGTVLNQTFTADPDDDEMFTSENFSMEVSSDSIFVESDDPIIGEGGQFEITFKVKINPNSTLDDFREYGQVYRVNERLVFKNNAKTTLDDEEHTTNLVKTYVPLDTSLKINKNVTGNLGDLTKEFEYELKLTGLKPEKKYNYEKPTYVRVAAEYDVSERVNIEATDENSEPVSDVQVNIFEISFNDNGDEIKTLYAKRKTNAEGKTSFLLEPGDYYYEYSYDGETISGYFSSDFYSDDTTFEGDVGEIEELFLPRTDYDTDKYFITDENGEAVIDFKLKDDQSMHLTGLPLGIGYQITEKASNHTPSYRVVRGADSVESPSDSREDKEEELSTPEEKLDESTEYTFTNHRELEPTTSANTFLWILIIIVLTALMILVKKHLNKADEMDF